MQKTEKRQDDFEDQPRRVVAYWECVCVSRSPVPSRNQEAIGGSTGPSQAAGLRSLGTESRSKLLLTELEQPLAQPSRCTDGWPWGRGRHERWEVAEGLSVKDSPRRLPPASSVPARQPGPSWTVGTPCPEHRPQNRTLDNKAVAGLLLKIGPQIG